MPSAAATTKRKRNLKIVRIGNSRGVRLPKDLLDRYGFRDELIAEETEEGLLLTPRPETKFTWEETFQAIAEEAEPWDDFDVAVADGLEEDGGQ